MTPNNNIVSFFKRYWLLLTAFAISFAVSRTDTAFGWMGTLVYLPVLSFGSILSALGIRHFFFAQSLDDDANSGWFVQKWKALPDESRIKYNLMMVAAFFLGVAWIAAAMIR